MGTVFVDQKHPFLSREHIIAFMALNVSYDICNYFSITRTDFVTEINFPLSHQSSLHKQWDFPSLPMKASLGNSLFQISIHFSEEAIIKRGEIFHRLQ